MRLGDDAGRLVLASRSRSSGIAFAAVYAGLSAAVADPGTAVYRRGHGRRAAPPDPVVTAVEPTGVGSLRRGKRSRLLPAARGVGRCQSGQRLVGPSDRGGRRPTDGTDPERASMRIGAQILVRDPQPMPWGFAYAPRGPVAGCVGPVDDRGPHRCGPVRATAPPRAGSATCGSTPRSRWTARTTPTASSAAALRPSGWRPAPPIQPNADPDHRPAGRRGGAVGRAAQEVAPVRQQGAVGRHRGRRRGRRSARASSTGSTARRPTAPAS